ncbi:hypothetical protein TNCV_1735611 [Trichonephila clavipes]|nr:hypothetical protein TNCV_1735611 [Trichonephila clavipes]
MAFGKKKFLFPSELFERPKKAQLDEFRKIGTLKGRRIFRELEVKELGNEERKKRGLVCDAMFPSYLTEKSW